MEFLRLSLGLAVPWLGGYFWLRFLEGKLAPQASPHPLRQLGYGFFLGYAGLGLALLVSSAYGAVVSYGPIISALILITLAGMVLALKLKPIAGPPQWASSRRMQGPARLLFCLLLAWLGLHLLLNAMEIFMRPVYPWDAWLAWIYRAKAWFYSANVFDLATPEQWLAGGTDSPYAIAAADYPDFASLIPFWAATSLGRWSETLINLPVLLCGLALVFGVYGQAREYGMNPLLAALAAYLLVSIPLVGTHLSLAGYADIWMVGFTGLGFVALVRGLAESNRVQLLLGVGMLLLSIGVKNEGVVWLYSALALIILATLRPRTLWITIASITIIGLLAVATDFTAIELPWLGKAGIADGLVHVPFAGSHNLISYNSAPAYLKAFFMQASWNIFWPLLLITVAAFSFRPGGKLTRVSLIFFLIVALGQSFIFSLTEQGRWAESLTAINRLPLHFTPALLFCALACLHHFLPGGAKEHPQAGSQKQRSKASTLLPAIAAATAVALGLALYLNASYPSTEGDSYRADYSDMRVVMGSGEKRQSELLVNGFRNGGAVVTTGTVNLDANLLNILNYNVHTLGNKAPSFFWRLAETPDKLETFKISGSGPGSLNLTSLPNWRGRIKEAGFVVYGDGENPATVTSLTLLPSRVTRNLGVIWDSWLTFEGWNQKSINWLRGGAQTQLVSITLLASIWLLLTAIFYAAFALRSSTLSRAVVPVFICALLCWVILDIRWTNNRITQTVHTMNFAKSREGRSYIDVGDDIMLENLVYEAKTHMKATAEQRTLIIGGSSTDEFKLLRAKYHLLPIPAIVRPHPAVKDAPNQTISAFVLIDDGKRGPGSESATALEKLSGISTMEGRNASQISTNAIGRVYILESSN